MRSDRGSGDVMLCNKREGDYRMREVKPDGPRIYTDKLYGASRGIVMVGSESWQEWLQEEEAQEFVFRAADVAGAGAGAVDGSWHRARRECRGNSAYWYVSCRVGGKLRRFYMGGAKTLDKARLEAVAEAIATARTKVMEEEG